MRIRLSIVWMLLLGQAAWLQAEDGANHKSQVVLVVVGASGSADYEKQFHAWADRWQTAASSAAAEYIEIGRQSAADATDHLRLKQAVGSADVSAKTPLWLVLIGHGTFYRDQARFNLRGPDVLGKELAEWIKPVTRPLIVVNCASCSGPFIDRLSSEGRVIVTATRSGSEQNYARFGDYFSSSIVDADSDLDHDEQVSLLEAFLSASRKVAQYYEQESRLVTEHALLDDNGDRLGTPATFFRGIRAVRSARSGASVDGLRAARLGLALDADRKFSAAEQAAREEIELEIDRLRAVRRNLDDEAYYQQLEPLMIRLARLYEKVETSVGDDIQKKSSESSKE